MRSLEYVSTATGGSIGFEGPLYGETLTGLRGRAWDYSLSSRGLTGVTRKTREETVTVKIHDSPATLDLLARLADADMAAGSPGTLVADGEWETRAWIAKSEPQTITPTMVETQLTIVLADGVWRRRTTEHHDPRNDKAGGDLDYPYDYPHDYAGMSILDTVTNATGMPQPVKLTIFGPCVNPYIIIGTNRYEVDATIPAGSRLEIDAASDSRTVTMISDTGLRTNLFAKAVRGAGRGSGTYVFEPLPPGTSIISWAGGFEFDLTAIEERSEPPWT
ncbi:hypothetical protein KIH75_08365 [Bifidobacterium sp. 64T4]|uniref:hypothetical protein n=1 Tax=Bifidobacterium pongonis TaxID=2834432 RepID=UPI001C589E89|nr:hypothetical protein [Bifidobacterium pongonis]MBW3095339.1 hypothetical protein [Bifidobacterium pongonis]